MFVIIGLGLVFFAVIGGFLMEGGAIGALIQPAELLIIGGAGLGTIFISAGPSLMTRIFKDVMRTVGGSKYSKTTYLDVLKMMYELFQAAKRDGLMGLEQHIERPADSSIISKYPGFLANSHAVEFFCDTLKVVLNGGVPPQDMDDLMEVDLETHHEETAKSPVLLTKVGDAMPGLGIVAAVLGVVITMGAIDGPPAEIGHKVGAALVGTFLGILLSYGFIQPLAVQIESLNQVEARYYGCMRSCISAFVKGMPPIVCVEFARRSIFATERPTFSETEDACKQTR
jgi:chemotaxis protein MotA